MQVQQVIANLRKESKTLQVAQESVHAAIKVLENALPNGAVPRKAKGKKRKKLSAEARAKIGAAAKARWEKKRAEERK